MSQAGDMIKRRIMPIIRRWVLILGYGFGACLVTSWIVILKKGGEIDGWQLIFVALVLIIASINAYHRR